MRARESVVDVADQLLVSLPNGISHSVAGNGLHAIDEMDTWLAVGWV